MVASEYPALPTGSIVNAPCGYLTINEQGKVIWANGTLAAWLGKNLNDVLSEPASAIFALASAVVFETSLLPLLRLQKEVSGVSLDLMAHDGTKIPVIISADSIVDRADRSTRIVLLKAAARREFEQELIKARAQAEADLTAEQRQGELREQFVAILGHDLRNPLTAMSSGIRMISRETDENRKAEIAGLVQGSVQRMSHLIDNVLDFARNRLGGGIDLDLDNGDVEGAIRQAVDELVFSNPDRDLKIEVSIQHDVICDVWRVGQVVSNLLGNALTHGDRDQPVTVKAKSYATGALEIIVSNHGEPIPENKLNRMFEPFERNGKEGREGLGLGLFISAKIAEAHGGQLDVTSDEITRFRFKIPARRDLA